MNKDVLLYDGNFEIKMSEVILDLAEDLLKAAKTKAQHQKAIMITCMAWNLAILPDEELKEKLDQFLDTLGDLQAKKDVQNIIATLIEMKYAYYPHVDRLILDYELMGEYPNFHLNVASTPPRESLKDKK